ncbi:MAG: PQQ-binding-like beta-propeller repeat protein [Verrucomicrobia bacterium]|nr:PQQ-binding-like beta-propeller repeat protein [Verrucomicrobiota bacterium]
MTNELEQGIGSWIAKLGIGLCLFGVSFESVAGDWPHWRGPFFNGSSDETNLPTSWSKSDNVAWTVDLPGPSAATPIVWGDKVFISTTDAGEQTLEAMALDRKSGKVLWQHKIADAFAKDRLSNYASPSPTTDGKTVVFFYGNGDLVAFDFSGQKLWARNLQTDYGDFAFLFTFSSSPTLIDGRLYMQVLQRDVPVGGRGRKDGPIESFLLALDATTGKTVWKQTRPTEAVAESHEAYSTPIPIFAEGRRELLIAGGDCLTGHALDTGKELWRWGTWNPKRFSHWRLVPSPVTGADVILVCAPKGAPVYAVRTGGSGVLDQSWVQWTSESHREVSSDVPTPLFYMGDFFILNDLRGMLSRVDPKTGKPKWTVSLPGRAKYEASPTGAGGRIYTVNFRGDVAVLDANTGETLANVPMGDGDEDRIRSSVAIAHGQLFVRTNKRLYAVAAKTP